MSIKQDQTVVYSAQQLARIAEQESIVRHGFEKETTL